MDIYRSSAVALLRRVHYSAHSLNPWEGYQVGYDTFFNQVRDHGYGSARASASPLNSVDFTEQKVIQGMDSSAKGSSLGDADGTSSTLDRVKKKGSAKRTRPDEPPVLGGERGPYSDFDDKQLGQLLEIIACYLRHARATNWSQALLNPSEEPQAFELYVAAVAHSDGILAEIRSRKRGHRDTSAKSRGCVLSSSPKNVR